MLHAALHCHLQKHSSTVTDDIAENVYVDNVVTGCATETEAVKFYKEAIKSIQVQLESIGFKS